MELYNLNFSSIKIDFKFSIKFLNIIFTIHNAFELLKI